LLHSPFLKMWQKKAQYDASWGEAEEEWNEEQPTQGFQRTQVKSGIMPVKKEPVDRLPGETERQAKIRKMTEKFRQEAKDAVAGKAPADPKPAAGKTSANGAPAAAPAETASPQKRKAPAMSPAALQAKEEEDGKKWDKMLPPLEEKVAAVEEEAEKIELLAAPLKMEAVDELKDLQLGAIRETERALKASAALVSTARRELEKKKRDIVSFAPTAQEAASEEMKKMTGRIDAAQAKMDEHKTVRKDHELAMAAGKLFGELSHKMASVEIDCEKAAMMAEPLGKAADSGVEVSTAELRESKEALRVAQATLAPTMRLISGKVSGLKGVMKEKMLELQSRAESSEALLDKATKTLDECQSRMAAAPILKQATERFDKVEEAMQAMRDSETPFLMGIETMPAEETEDVLSKMDQATNLATGLISDGLKFIELKMMEVGRLAEGAAEAVRADLEKVKKQFDETMEKAKKFQAETAKRRRESIVESIKWKVDQAETAISELKSSGDALKAAEPDAVDEVLEKALAAETAALAAVGTVRKELTDKDQDLKGADGKMKGGSDLLKTKVRVNYMEGELTKFRKMAKDFEEKMKVEKSLGDVQGSLKSAEEEVESLTATSQSWAKEEKPPEDEVQKITAVQGKLSSTTVKVEEKLTTAQGLELKELRGVFGRLQRTQWKLDRVKETVRDINKNISHKVIAEAREAVNKAEKQATEFSKVLPSLADAAADKLEELSGQRDSVLSSLAEAQRLLLLGQQGGLPTEAKVEFARLQLRWKAADRRGKAALDAVQGKLHDMEATAVGQALDALRAAARKDTKDGEVYDPDGLFNEISEGRDEVTKSQFADFFSIRAAEVTSEKVEVAYKKIAPHGLTRRVFASALASFFKCVKDITITDAFEIQTAKKVRKIEINELLEAVGGSRNDDTLGLERIQCRAIRDGVTGWITLRSHGGTVYLVDADKPYLWCMQPVALRSERDSDSRAVRELKPGECVELIQGPQEEKVLSDVRVRGTCCQEAAEGWLQVKDKAGAIFAQASNKVFKCIEAIAMTDVSDFEKCEMLRRITANEALELLEDAPVSPEEGGTRKKFRACSDGKEGWVTTAGSQGKVYVTAASKHYIVKQAAPLHTGLSAESDVVRVLMPGEAFAIHEEPKEVSGGKKNTLYLGRTVTDGSEGWVSCGRPSELSPWSKYYKVLKAVPLQKTLAANEAAESIEVVRLLVFDEILEATEPPMEDPSTGQLRVRLVAKKDKAVGWATVREGSTAESLSLKPIDEQEAMARTTSVGSAAPAESPGKGASKGSKRPMEGGGPKGGKRFKGQSKGKY